MDKETKVTPNAVIQLICPAGHGPVIYDADGSLSGMDEECWYCPKCLWFNDGDWYNYPRPVTA